MADSDRQLEAIILAAGKGTRMKSDLPKVLHEVADRPMLAWVIDACRDAGASRIVVVVGYKAELVKQTVGKHDDVVYVEQTEQNGTGHAVMVTEPVFAGRPACTLLVIAGDMPLFTGGSLRKLVDQHEASENAATLATATLDDPTGYGRIIRNAEGNFERIVEQKDASDAEQQITEVNISSYCFDSEAMFAALQSVSTDNAQGEYYLTDVLEILRKQGLGVSAANTIPGREAEGINNVEQLRRVDRMLRDRNSEGNEQ